MNLSTKWVIDLPEMTLYRFAENGELYKLPFESKGKNQLRPHLKVDNKPIILFEEKLPF